MNKTHTTQVNQQWFLQHTTPKNTNKRTYYNRHWYGKQVWCRGESSRSVEFRRWEASLIVRNNNDNNLLIFPLPIFPLHGENKGKN